MSGGIQTFRTDKEGTLSYFIGQNSKYASDTGFALKSWRESNSETSSVFVENDIAMWMGWVSLTNKGKELREHPHKGTGRPEKLKFDLAGLYSRRINQKHRLVYAVEESTAVVLILSAWAHYDDK